MTQNKNLSNTINMALATEPADLLVKGVTVLDVITGEERGPTNIAINKTTGMIVGVGDWYTDGGMDEDDVIDGTGLYAVPGFIDSHVHIESSLLTPQEYDRCVLPRGTTAIVCDPHEISNVLGEEALKYSLDSAENTEMEQFVNLSSCVPATPLETSGAELKVDSLRKFKHHHKVIGLAEFMDIGGVAGENPDTLDKLEEFSDRPIDGHMPSGITGPMLQALVACGIRNCHENTELEHAREKLRAGVQVFIREGTVCKDAVELSPLVEPFASPFLGVCTDDRNPLDIAEEGHLDHVIRTVIKNGADVASTYRMASWSAAQGFGLHHNTEKWRKRGIIGPGWQADINLIGDLKKCDVQTVIKKGHVVTAERFDRHKKITPVGYNSIKIKDITADDFAVKPPSGDLPPVIVLGDGGVVTSTSQESLLTDVDGNLQSDPAKDILKVTVLERHGKNGNIANWFVKGFGFKNGAIAASVGHDSHNITVVGSDDEQMALAVNRLKQNQGGFTVVKNGLVVGEMSLPVAGLMSDKSFEEVRQELETLKHATKTLGATVDEPLMHMIFLPLCVIPALKITDFGLVRFDPANGDQAPVLIYDQRKNKATPTVAPKL